MNTRHTRLFTLRLPHRYIPPVSIGGRVAVRSTDARRASMASIRFERRKTMEADGRMPRSKP
jgi:hypothetical protein